MFSFRTARNHFKHRIYFSNAMISCYSKCSFPMQQFKKVAPFQEQQFRLFRHSCCILQNSPNAASSMSPALVVDEATATNEKFPIAKEQQKEEKTERREELTTVGGPKDFGHKIYPIKMGKGLSCRYQMGKSGQKILQLSLGFGSTTTTTHNFANIHVPQDVFAFVQAMDEVLKAVHANKSIIEASNKRQEKLVLHTAKATGKNYDHQMELYVFNNIVYVQMRTLPNEHKPDHKPRFTFLLLHQLYWLRSAIGELFAANGEENVQQQLGKPPGYPTWLNIDGFPLVLIKRNQSQQRPINPANPSHFGLAEQRRIGQPPSNSSVGYNNRNQYNSTRNSLLNNRRNLQSQKPQNMQFDQRQLPQRVAPIQQPAQPAQPQMPPSPSSSSTSSPMSQQLLHLVFLQQQQLQQIQSSILGKMEEGRTTQNALAQPQQHQVVEPAAGMQYNGEFNSRRAMDYGNPSMQFMDRTSNYNYYNRNEQSGMQYNNERYYGQPMDYGGTRTAPRMASMQFENRTNNYGYDYRNAPQPTGMHYNNGRNLSQAMDYDGRMRTAPRMASPQRQEERISNSNYNNNNTRMPGLQYTGEWWQRNAAERNMAGVDQAAFDKPSSREARNAQSEPYFSQLLDDYE